MGEPDRLPPCRLAVGWPKCVSTLLLAAARSMNFMHFVRNKHKFINTQLVTGAIGN